VEWLIKAGLPANAALGAVFWTARSWLGLPGLADGATLWPTTPTQPSTPASLRHPSRVIMGGLVIL